MISLGIDPDIDFFFLWDVHRNMIASLRYSTDGSCTEEFEIKCGVRQGCIRAPFLFTLYISHFEAHLRSEGHDLPRLGIEPYRSSTTQTMRFC